MTMCRFGWLFMVVVLAACASSDRASDVALSSYEDSQVEGQVESSEQKEGTQPPTEPADDAPVNTLKWTTASEVDNFGFDIYRGSSAEGPFEKITSQPLAGAGTIDEPQRYVFVDEDIDPSRDYFYYIESISVHGVREEFSPIIRAPAKRPKGDGKSEKEPPPEL